jgi:hypothetical protein
MHYYFLGINLTYHHESQQRTRVVGHQYQTATEYNHREIKREDSLHVVIEKELFTLLTYVALYIYEYKEPQN